MERPILFNAKMVRAILEGRKTVTRRVVRRKELDAVLSSPARIANRDIPDCQFIERLCTAPCEPGDILWVRETWTAVPGGSYVYKASVECPDAWMGTWRPSIHMPKEAARIFLRVTGVRPERLREMVLADVLMEGVQEADTYEDTWDLWHQTWDSTIKPADRPVYGWAANPWVWVISFERVDRPEPGT